MMKSYLIKCQHCRTEDLPGEPDWLFENHPDHDTSECKYIIRDDQGIMFPCACDGVGGVNREIVANYGVAHPQWEGVVT